MSELAKSAAVSRSLLDARFRQMLGRSPIRYLTEWRMHLAQVSVVWANGSPVGLPVGCWR
ncbi:MAG: hypothetical protein M3070_08435 [Actinomycetota bacterium]|nr:hypothetical protein [Actinomycetota bacterium]